MKRLILMFLWVTVSSSLYSQIIQANDFATTGQTNTLMTFYSLSTGTKTTVSNVDWHLAFSVRASQFPYNTLQGTTIRLNGGMGVKAYIVPGFSLDSFSRTIDTTGFTNWTRLVDSDTAMDEGALNTGRNIQVFNYGWGVYTGSPNHDVVGDKVYLIELGNGFFKKMCIPELDRDTTWMIQVSNLDNSNQQIIKIPKRDYSGKNFVYVNLMDNSIKDKEPLSVDWDLVFLKYEAQDFSIRATPVVGVLSNKGTQIARRPNVNLLSNSYDIQTLSLDMNKIGWDWKYYIDVTQNLSGKNLVQLPSYYNIEDSLAFFVHSNNGSTYKIIFTDYSGYSTGMIYFYKQEFSPTAIEEQVAEVKNSIYPNPCNGSLFVSRTEAEPATVEIFDVDGRLNMQTNVAASLQRIDLSSLTSGVYIIRISSAKQTSTQRIIVSH